MVFGPPSWAPTVPLSSIPDSIPICDFILNEQHDRPKLTGSKTPFVWGTTGEGYTPTEVRQRVDYLARALSREFGWHPNGGSEWDKVACVFSHNTVDYFPLTWAIHRLSGVATLANSGYSAEELAFQLRASKATSLFTCVPLLKTGLEAASKCGIPYSRVFLFDMPQEFLAGHERPDNFKTVGKLVEEGSRLGGLDPAIWTKGQATRQCAYLCFSSGTSGLPKGVMVSHRNVMSEILLLKQFESHTRTVDQKDVVLGLLPYSHIFGLSVFCAAVFRGETVVVLPKFELRTLLDAIQRTKINTLYLVPPIIVAMLQNEALMKKYDLSSVRQIITGAAPLGLETAEDLQRIQPTWSILQAYGLTETTAVATHTSPHDVYFGSSGCLLPLLEARIVSPDGKDIDEHDTPGELLLRGPTIVPGYFNNEEANKETFENDWLKTGDEAVVKKSPGGEDHIFIVDRIKELIKVKGFQVAPAELEAHLLTHPAVADTAVVGVVDEHGAGELPKAFVVRAKGIATSDGDLARQIQKHVEDHKAHYKALRGGVEFIDIIPKSPSGKILRRHLRDRERRATTKGRAKL